MIQFEQKRKRKSEKDLDVNYLRELKNQYFGLMSEAYRDKPLTLQTFVNKDISERSFIWKYIRQIDPKKRNALQRRIKNLIQQNEIYMDRTL